MVNAEYPDSTQPPYRGYPQPNSVPPVQPYQHMVPVPSNLPVPAQRHPIGPGVGQYAYPPAPSPYPAAYAVRPVRSAGAAVALEIVPGLFGIFGIGSIYAGRTGTGLALMISFWVLFWINVVLMFVFIGFITMPLTWVGYLIAGPILAARAVEQHNLGR